MKMATLLFYKGKWKLPAMAVNTKLSQSYVTLGKVNIWGPQWASVVFSFSLELNQCCTVDWLQKLKINQ